ncbi:MAG: PKD domain-containing protein, partial [Chloroflexi bacterium]|nr:PKD domain-containing protein [Chloroflexota bacterium]MBU1661474.1 PKD domain-containing protein [Chloroflexota bacterium]
SYSELVLWPWGFTATNAPNGTALQTLGRKFAYYNNYRPEQAMSLYATDGTTDDFAYGDMGLAAYTFELGTTFFQSCSVFENTILPDNLPALIYAAKTSRTPYMTPAGPDALSMTVVPGGVDPGDPAQLMATINDTRFNNSNGTEPTQNITAAEYYIDVPAWITMTTPIAYPMTAVDGNFNSTVEAVEAAVDTTGLSSGRHTLFVRGQDAAGNWGPFTAVFIYIVEPGVSPVIDGYVRDASNNAPIEATLTAGTFQATSDPVTGYYSTTVISGTYAMNASATGYADANVSGVIAHDYQTVQQNFHLYPVCDIFTDTVESGNQGWTAEFPWAITTEASHSPSHSWTDSPGGNYNNNRDISLTSPIMDMTDFTDIHLDFWQICDTEANWDFCHVEISNNGGSTWTGIATYDGSHSQWENITLAVGMLNNQLSARIRFRFTSDTNTIDNGWHIDDLTISGGGPGCGETATPPAAAFTSDSPVAPGMPMHFTNMTTGTLPMDHIWDFGDGIGTSIESDPVYTYTIANVYTVTLVATNSLDSDSVSHQVVVELVDIDQVDLTLVTTGTIVTNTLVEFAADIIPNGATKPYTYTLDFGDATMPVTATSSSDPLPITHTFATTGTFPVTIGVRNLGMTAPVTDAVSVTVSAEVIYSSVTDVDLTLVTTGTIYAGEAADFLADLSPNDANKPYSYTIDYDDGTVPITGTSSFDPLLLTHTFAATGTYTVAIDVWNLGMTIPVTDAVSVTVYEPSVCVDLTNITINGAAGGEPGMYTFTASYEPAGASLPVTYLWDNDDTTAASTRTLGTGTHNLAVTATNCTAASVGDEHTIVITNVFNIFLPLVTR